MSARITRSVSLTPELDAFVDEHVAPGRYRMASGAMRAALRAPWECGKPAGRKSDTSSSSLSDA